jgi:hypothetical protein
MKNKKKFITFSVRVTEENLAFIDSFREEDEPRNRAVNRIIQIAKKVKNKSIKPSENSLFS